MLCELCDVRQRLEFGLKVVCAHGDVMYMQLGTPTSHLNSVGNYLKPLALWHAICHDSFHRSRAAMQSQDEARSDRASADAPRATDQRRCWVNQRAVDVSPGIECMGTDDGATQKATQAVKKLEAHKTRWSQPSES